MLLVTGSHNNPVGEDWKCTGRPGGKWSFSPFFFWQHSSFAPLRCPSFLYRWCAQRLFLKLGRRAPSGHVKGQKFPRNRYFLAALTAALGVSLAGSELATCNRTAKPRIIITQNRALSHINLDSTEFSLVNG
jgi:hypothetical protein